MKMDYPEFAKALLLKKSYTYYNKLTGEYKIWYRNGQLEVHCFYKNDKLEGEYKEWWGNGQLYIHCFYKNGKKEREYKIWHFNGQLGVHYFYKSDKRIELPKDKIKDGYIYVDRKYYKD